jgi:3-dehydroquinate synthase
MKTVHVDLGSRSYNIHIDSGLLKRTAELFDQNDIGKRIFLVANTTVFRLHGPRVEESLANAGYEVVKIFIPDGEQCKNLHTVENIYTYLIAQRADRGSVIAALGGGVTGDISGFVAATFMRGVQFVQIPTTLLAQVDSSVGGKTGVNHPHGKNLIGVFHQPNLVCVDTNTLSTLPDREFRSGLYEVIKYGLIADSSFFDYLESTMPKILERDEAALEKVIGRCCEIKAKVTSLDECDTDLRRILNFGHTFGHALEVATDFRGLTHGEGVAYGMTAASSLSEKLGFIDKGTLRRIAQVIRSVGELPPIDRVSVVELMEAMEMDKKRTSGRKVLVLLSEIGETEIRSDIDDSEIQTTWREAILNQAATSMG